MDVFKKYTSSLIIKSRTKKIKQEYLDAWNCLLELVKNELTKKNTYIPNPVSKINILLTMTSCKRYNLFQQTVNSIINNWHDVSLVDKWIVVDDNSSDEDRKKMLEYGFIEYIMKNEDQKGHMESMNIIYDKIVETDTTYWIHIEDDFLFFHSMPYVCVGLKGLNILDKFNVKQIMYNRNFMETFDQINLPGHIVYSDNEYSLHDYIPGSNACRYWPNYSFRPSLVEAETIRKLGNFTSSNTFFERDYAEKYTKAGYRTAFYNSITCNHIGRLCNTSGNNAYDLNNVKQFGSSKKNFNIKLVNLKRRTDRLTEMTKKFKEQGLTFDVFEAVDGSQITLTEAQELMFKDNDFRSKRGVIGCALSHYQLWKELVKSDCSYYIIIEDDAEFCNNFADKLSHILDHITSKEIIFMGYLKTKKNKLDFFDTYNVESDTTKIESLKGDLYVGGTHCYSITKEGANGLIDFIDMHGIPHGIDYLMAKLQKVVPVYETVPHLAFAEWQDSPDNIIDSDIQFDTNKPLLSPVEGYIFIQGLDQMGNDISVNNRDGLTVLVNQANSMSNCVAFNTLGFFKSSIDNLVPSIYFSEKDGIYIKSDYYYNVFKKK